MLTKLTLAQDTLVGESRLLAMASTCAAKLMTDTTSLGAAGTCAAKLMTDAGRAFHESSGIHSMLEDIKHDQKLIPAPTGPFAELYRTEMFDHVSQGLYAAQREMADLAARFRLPEIIAVQVS